VPKTETINPKTIDSAALNLAVVRGEVSSPPEVRVLPSEAVLVQLQVTTRLEHETLSTPIAVWNPPAWVEELEPGTELVVVGRVRRRFFRAAGAVPVPPSDRRNQGTALQATESAASMTVGAGRRGPLDTRRPRALTMQRGPVWQDPAQVDVSAGRGEYGGIGRKGNSHGEDCRQESEKPADRAPGPKMRSGGWSYRDHACEAP